MPDDLGRLLMFQIWRPKGEKVRKCIFINDCPLRISNDEVNNNLFADDSSPHTIQSNFVVSV